MSPLALVTLVCLGQARPTEAELFGGDSEPLDAGTVEVLADAGIDLDSQRLMGAPSKSRFDTDETKSDPLKVGGSLLLTLQLAANEGAPLEQAAISAPFVLDTYLDARPSDRLRAYVVGRLQYDPTRPMSDATTTTTGSGIGLTAATSSNPSVFLDQLWLRFDVARKVYLTVGRQKVRWGTAHIWYPTDFLNSQPRDALNPFDVRLGVNMVKAHVPIESLGWNFYAYGILDNIATGASGLTVERLGGAVRGEFVLGPAEVGVGGVWLKGRRPRYAIDVSTPLGPVDLYAEAAFRSGRDFLKFTVPTGLTTDGFIDALTNGTFDSLTPQTRPDGLVVQSSIGVSYQFKYTEANSAILSAEYFYNPVGYQNPVEYLVQTFHTAIEGLKPDPLQQVPLYGGQHYVALIITAPGLPDLPWISLTLVNVVNLSDPSALTRLDASFRVLTYLTVQGWAAVFYGQTGGELRFQLPSRIVSSLQLPSTLSQPPLFQAGVLLRVSM